MFIQTTGGNLVWYRLSAARRRWQVGIGGVGARRGGEGQAVATWRRKHSSCAAVCWSTPGPQV